MKVKRILRFYFSAEKLNRAVDNLILKRACAPDTDGWEGAEKLLVLIGEKQELQRLWHYLDVIVGRLPAKDRNSLERYAAMRNGLKSLETQERLKLKSAITKFRRRVKMLEAFDGGLELIGKYYCLLQPTCRDGSISSFYP